MDCNAVRVLIFLICRLQSCSPGCPTVLQTNRSTSQDSTLWAHDFLPDDGGRRLALWNVSSLWSRCILSSNLTQPPIVSIAPLPYFPIAQRSHHFISPWSHLPTVPPSLCPIIQSPICAISHHTLPPVPLPHCSLVPSPQSNLPRAPSSHVSSHCLIIPLADCALLAENARSESAPQPLSRKGGGKAGFMRTMKAAGSWCLMAKSFSVERVLYLFLSERNQFWWSSDEKWIVQLTHYYIIHILSKKKK